MPPIQSVHLESFFLEKRALEKHVDIGGELGQVSITWNLLMFHSMIPGSQDIVFRPSYNLPGVTARNSKATRRDTFRCRSQLHIHHVALYLRSLAPGS